MIAIDWSRVEDGRAQRTDRHLSADVVVIGTGAGGAVAAATLAEGGANVLMIEEGGYYTGRDFRGDPMEGFNTLYRSGGLTATVGNAMIALPMGKCVGGTTTINSGTCYRTPDWVLDEWRTLHGVAAMSAADMEDDFVAIERALGVKPVPEENLNEGARRFAAGAKALGYDGAPIPRNEHGCRATGVCAFGCPRDAKAATSVSYVPRALAAGSRLATWCKVDRILTDRGRAVGVVARYTDEKGRETGASLRVVANAVFVAAGAIHTPRLLARSKVGANATHLGHHLRTHPAARVAAVFPDEIRGWEGVPQSYNVHFTNEGFFVQGQFTPPGVEASMLPFAGARHRDLMDNFDKMTSFGALLSDTSEGRVIGAGSGDPLLWYWMNAHDVRTMARAISITSQIFFAAGAREVYPCVRKSPVVRSMDEAKEIANLKLKASDIDMMAFHPMGTARMGGDPARSVTDAWGAVHGVPGLFVADASLMSGSTKLNPLITIMALARRVARRHLAYA